MAEEVQHPSRRGKGFLAAVASMLLPGLGQFVAGRTKRGVFLVALYLVLTCLGLAGLMVPRLIPALIVLIPANALVQLGSVIDAYVCGRRSGRAMLGRPAARYAVAAGILLAGVFDHPAMHVVRYVLTWSETFRMFSASMEPTLRAGDCFLAYKRGGPPARWQIVVFDHRVPDGPGFRSAFRVVGLPGETIEIRGGRAFVNNVAADPPPGVGPFQRPALFGRAGMGGEGNPIHLGPDEYFVLGDNQARANDSRYWNLPDGDHQPGALPRERIVGRVTAIYWPPNRWRRFE